MRYRGHVSHLHTARQFWIRAPGHGEIVRAQLAPRREDEVLVRTRYSAVSRGTESLVFRGEVPSSQHEAMRAPFRRFSHGRARCWPIATSSSSSRTPAANRQAASGSS